MLGALKLSNSGLQHSSFFSTFWWKWSNEHWIRMRWRMQDFFLGGGGGLSQAWKRWCKSWVPPPLPHQLFSLFSDLKILGHFSRHRVYRGTHRFSDPKGGGGGWTPISSPLHACLIGWNSNLNSYLFIMHNPIYTDPTIHLRLFNVIKHFLLELLAWGYITSTRKTFSKHISRSSLIMRDKNPKWLILIYTCKVSGHNSKCKMYSLQFHTDYHWTLYGD